MGVYGGKGPMVNAVLWVEVVVLVIFVAMRLYTRIAILNSAGADDYLVVAALVLHVLYTIFVHIATGYGLGQLYADVGDTNSYSTALMYEICSQVAGIMAIGVGKCAVGVFLLRIVVNKIQIGFLYGFLAATTFITLFASITVVIQCIPPERIWNQAAEGYCWLDFSKVGFTVGSWFVLADFAFAALPWFVIWSLNMKRKEKITIACGLSLGIFAGVCGIVRTVALGSLNASEYIYDTVPMLIWSATESLVTIMCSTIPVLRPLYVQFKYGSQGDSSANTGNNKSSYNMPMYPNRSKYGTGSRFGNSVSAGTDLPSEGGRHQATVATAYPIGNDSDESILRSTRAENMADLSIKRTDEVSVSYENYKK